MYIHTYSHRKYIHTYSHTYIHTHIECLYIYCIYRMSAAAFPMLYTYYTIK